MKFFKRMSLVPKGLRYKLMVAFSLMSIIPLLVAVYLVRDYIFAVFMAILSHQPGVSASGDIIGITTNIDGLDVSHTGIAIRLEDGLIHFLHAPLKGHKVEITDITLAEYVLNNEHQTGIYVARPLEPEK